MDTSAIIVKDSETGERVTDRISVILGERAGMTKKQAREALAREGAKRKGWFTANAPVLNDSRVTFDWFVRNRYIPLKKGDWKEETAKNKIALIESDLLEDLGDIPLRNFTRYDLQMQVNKLAETRSRDRVLQMRAYLRDIFSEALDQDFLVKDPALRVKVPGQLKQTDKTTLTWDQLRMVLDELTAMERILIELDMTEALRPGELFGSAVEVLRPEAFEPQAPGDGIQGEDPELGQDRKKPQHDPPAACPGSRSRGVEENLPGFFS